MRITTLIHWPTPGSVKIEDADPEAINGALNRIRQFALELRQVLNRRDVNVARAINQLDIEIVEAEPTAAPDYPEPVMKLYKSGSTWRLYAYTGATDGWVYFNSDG